MSDLFTQDVEDMPDQPEPPQAPASQAKPEAEPFADDHSFAPPQAKPSPQAQREVDALDVAGMSCDLCGKPMVRRNGKRGAFMACTGYPDCRNTRNV